MLGIYVLSHSVMSDSLPPFGLQPSRILCPWDFSGKNTGVGCQFLLQGILLTQGSNPCLLCLLHCRWILYPLNHNIFAWLLKKKTYLVLWFSVRGQLETGCSCLKKKKKIYSDLPLLMTLMFSTSGFVAALVADNTEIYSQSISSICWRVVWR